MNILILCTKYSLDRKDPWLTNDLANAFAQQNHKVIVLLLDWQANSITPIIEESEQGISVIRISPISVTYFGPKIAQIIKWCLSTYKIKKQIKQHLRTQPIDLLISFSPSVIVKAAVQYCKKVFNCKAYLIHWDFFPFHHQKMKLIKSKALFYICRWLETKAVREFDYIACMTSKNVDYFLAKYGINKQQTICVLPVWGGSDEVMPENQNAMRNKYQLPLNKIIVVFGGQLTSGRGIDDILMVADHLQKEDTFHFLFIGSGDLAIKIREKIQQGSNLTLFERIPRADYLALLTACDIALVTLIKEIDIPTFPSKTVDYLRVALPIVASISEGTDYEKFIIDSNAGLFSWADDSHHFIENLNALAQSKERREALGNNGKRYFNANMEVSHIVKKIISHTSMEVKQ